MSRSSRKSSSVASMIIAAVCSMSRSNAQDYSTENMCGALALITAATASGASLDIDELLVQLPLDGETKSFGDLTEAAAKLGLSTRAMRWDKSRVPDVSTPCIVRLVPGVRGVGAHFVVLLAATREAVCLVSPPQRPTWLPTGELLEQWDGVTLYVAPDPRVLDNSSPNQSSTYIKISLSLALLGIVSLLVGCLRSRKARSNEGESGQAWQFIPILAAGCCLMLFGLVNAFGSPNRSTIRAVITVDNARRTLDLRGRTSEVDDGLIKERFVLTNHGVATALIGDIVPSCICTSVTASTKRIEPGQSAIIEAKIDAGQLSDGAATTLVVELPNSVPERLKLVIVVKRNPTPSSLR